jgi:hypothetical protein
MFSDVFITIGLHVLAWKEEALLILDHHLLLLHLEWMAA